MKKLLVFSSSMILSSLIWEMKPAFSGCTTYGSSIVVDCTAPRYTPRHYEWDDGLGTYRGQNYWELQSGSTVSPTYTSSNPALLSSNVLFPISRGMLAIVKTNNGGVLNVRSASGLNSPVIKTLKSRTQITLSGLKTKGWVELNEGGWVHSDYLQPL